MREAPLGDPSLIPIVAAACYQEHLVGQRLVLAIVTVPEPDTEPKKKCASVDKSQRVEPCCHAIKGLILDKLHSLPVPLHFYL